MCVILPFSKPYPLGASIEHLLLYMFTFTENKHKLYV